MSNKLYFKCLPKNMVAYGDFKWPPLGEWAPKASYVRMCESGYHLASLQSISMWIVGRPTLYLAEARGKKHGSFYENSTHYRDNKIAFAQARLIRKLTTSKKDLGPILTFFKKEIKKYNKENSIWPIYIHQISNSNNTFQYTFFEVVKITCEWLNDKTFKSKHPLAISFLKKLENLWDVDFGLPCKKTKVWR